MAPKSFYAGKVHLCIKEIALAHMLFQTDVVKSGSYLEVINSFHGNWKFFVGKMYLNIYILNKLSSNSSQVIIDCWI